MRHLFPVLCIPQSLPVLQMKILCPVTKIVPAARDSVLSFAPGAEFVDTSLSEYAYWEVVSSRWGKDDLIIIEHDIQIYPDTVPALAQCTKQWCTFGYFAFSPPQFISWGLGCVKITQHMQYNAGPVPRVPWQHLDGVISEMLSEDYWPHVHGVVTHHHSYQATARPSPEEARQVMHDLTRDRLPQ